MVVVAGKMIAGELGLVMEIEVQQIPEKFEIKLLLISSAAVAETKKNKIKNIYIEKRSFNEYKVNYFK